MDRVLKLELNRLVHPSVQLGGLALIRTLLASSFLAAGLLLAGSSQPANAVWVCGPVQCVWDPTPDVGYVAPAYATTWGAPLYPGCYWKRGLFGRWKMICP